MRKQTAIKIVIGIICISSFMGQRVVGDNTGFCGIPVSAPSNKCNPSDGCDRYMVKSPADQECWGPGTRFCIDDGFGYAVCSDYVGGSCVSGLCQSGWWAGSSVGSYVKKTLGMSCVG